MNNFQSKATPSLDDGCAHPAYRDAQQWPAHLPQPRTLPASQSSLTHSATDIALLQQCLVISYPNVAIWPHPGQSAFQLIKNHHIYIPLSWGFQVPVLGTVLSLQKDTINQGNCYERSLIAGLLAVSVGWPIITAVGSRQAWRWSNS